MRKIRFQEDQRYGRRDVVLIAAVLGVLCLLPLLSLISGAEIGAKEILLWVFMIALVAGVLWYITHLKLSLVVNDKNIKVHTSPLSVDKKKIKWKDVDRIDCHALPRMYQWRGWNVHFSSGNKWHNISGKGVLHIQEKDGGKHVIGCRRFDEMLEVLKGLERTRDLVRHGGAAPGG